MSYFTKEEVLNFIKENNEKIKDKGNKPLTPIEQSMSQIENEEDVVGFFWMDFQNDDTDALNIKMEGKVFVRIDLNLYTDDRFAIDLYQSQKQGVTVSQVIKDREFEQKRVQKTILKSEE